MSTLLSYVDPQDADGTNYSLTLKNESAAAWTFYVFQKAPQASPNIFSLAWFASPFTIVQGNQITFQWQIDYNFVWSSTRTLAPGVIFNASGVQPASPSGANTTQFTTSPGPHLTTPAQGQPSGSLVINDQSNVPNNQYSVGVGMSGNGTYAVQAGPNLTHTFTPTPNYWIGAGTNIQVGQVMEITTSNPVEQVEFPPNVFNLTYELNQSNLWVLSN